MTPATLEQARAAKAKLAEALVDVPEVDTLGIALLDGGFGVKVNLVMATAFPIPDEIDGVPVLVVIVGSIYPL